MTNTEKRELKQANENPWYCLATIFGEQVTDARRDRELDAKNRKAWNRWCAAALNDELRKKLVANGFPEAEIAPLSPKERSHFCSAFAARVGREDEPPPNPDDSVDFSYTHFTRDAIFEGFLFALNNFQMATFSCHAGFRSATFSGIAQFSSATFSRGASFPKTAFRNVANFNSATFSGAAYFASTTFSDYADFRSATFFDDVEFGFAKFSRAANFLDAKFTAHATFANAGFATRVPDFRGATMHDVTEWHGISWPAPPEDKFAAQDQVYAYERLRQEAERLKKHEDEQRFFRRELRARRGLLRPWSGEWLLNYLYQVTSDYGLSICRPLLWLFVVFVVGGTVFCRMPMTIPGSAALSFEMIPHAAALSFANVFPFLPIAHEIITSSLATGLTKTEKIVGVVQSLFGTPLLFLLGLALRNRFRMR